MAALHNNCSALSKADVVSRVRIMHASLKRRLVAEHVFIKAVERAVVFSLNKRGDVWWSIFFVYEVTTEEGRSTFPDS
jgi:hypothetical protein